MHNITVFFLLFYQTQQLTYTWKAAHAERNRLRRIYKMCCKCSTIFDVVLCCVCMCIEDKVSHSLVRSNRSAFERSFYTFLLFCFRLSSSFAAIVIVVVFSFSLFHVFHPSLTHGRLYLFAVLLCKKFETIFVKKCVCVCVCFSFFFLYDFEYDDIYNVIFSRPVCFIRIIYV